MVTLILLSRLFASHPHDLIVLIVQAGYCVLPPYAI